MCFLWSLCSVPVRPLCLWEQGHFPAQRLPRQWWYWGTQEINTWGVQENQFEISRLSFHTRQRIFKLKLVLKGFPASLLYSAQNPATPLYVAFPYILYIKDLVLSQCRANARCVSGCTQGCYTCGLPAGLPVPPVSLWAAGLWMPAITSGSHVGTCLGTRHLYPLSHLTGHMRTRGERVNRLIAAVKVSALALARVVIFLKFCK